MTRYEYRVIPAPAEGGRARGAKTPGARFAQAFEEAVNAQAAQGWEYLRAEALPWADRPHWLSRPKVTEQHVLVFRRAAGPGEAAQAAAPGASVQPLRAGEGLAAGPGPGAAPGPVPGPVLGPARSRNGSSAATPLRPEPRIRTD